MTADALRRLQAHTAQVYRQGYVLDAAGQRRPIVPSGLALETGHALRDLIVSEGATTTLEVGFALGLSTLHICEALLMQSTAGSHIAIDPLERSNFGSAGLLSVEAAGVAHLVEHREVSSDLALPALLQERRGQFDFALVDGAHWFDYAFVDAFFCMQLVRPGAIVVLDDTWMPGPRLAARYLVTNLGCTELPGLLPPHLTVVRTAEAGQFSRHHEAFVPFFDPAQTVASRLAGLGRAVRRRVSRFSSVTRQG